MIKYIYADCSERTVAKTTCGSCQVCEDSRSGAYCKDLQRSSGGCNVNVRITVSGTGRGSGTEDFRWSSSESGTGSTTIRYTTTAGRAAGSSASTSRTTRTRGTSYTTAGLSGGVSASRTARVSGSASASLSGGISVSGGISSQRTATRVSRYRPYERRNSLWVCYDDFHRAPVDTYGRMIMSSLQYCAYGCREYDGSCEPGPTRYTRNSERRYYSG